MSALRSVHMVCNGCDKSEGIVVHKFADARAIVAAAGWDVGVGDGSDDLCEACRNPTVMRHGDNVIVSYGKRIVGRYPFPLGMPASEWAERLDALQITARRAEDEGEDPVLAQVVNFVRVESLVAASED